MCKKLLFSTAILLALSSGAFADDISGGVLPGQDQPAGANAAAPASGALDAVEVPQTSSSQGAKQPGERGEARADTGAAGAAPAQAGPADSVSAGTCIGFFGSKTYRLVSRGTVLYRVVPTTFFDVTMRVTYVNLRSFFVDRFFAPGAESILVRGPSSARSVNVTIRGFNGQRGCFRFFAG